MKQQHLRCLFGAVLILVCLSPLLAQTSNMETEYKRVSEVFDRRDKSAQKQLKAYLQSYPYTTYAEEIHFMQAVLLTERGYYSRAIQEFGKSNYKLLTRAHQPQFQFYRGYASLMQSDYTTASTYFSHLLKQESDYRQRACYYYAYCQYKLEDFDKALPALLELENVRAYRATVPYYIAQIYYQRGEYSEVRDRAELLLVEQPDNQNNGELHRMLGEMHYRDGRYSDAVRELQAYDRTFSASKFALLRNDLYLLGKAQLRLKQYNEAIATFKRVTHQEDAISEDVNLCLGHAYVQLGNIEQAKLAYLAATRFRIDSNTHCEALYNYALTVYQSSSMIGESESVFTDFIAQYPESNHVDEIYALLADALRRAKNYQAALNALEAIEKPNRPLNQTKQFLRYQLGSDAFVQGHFEEAMKWFDAVIEDGTTTPVLTDTYYWRAEANYRLRKWMDCLRDLGVFFARPDAKQSPNFQMAYYLQGYAYFIQHQYTSAITAFKVHVTAVMTSALTYVDALNRLGDCYFNVRQYEEAYTYYSLSAQANASGSDYGYYYMASAAGARHQTKKKVEALQQLVNRYPKSDFADDALYEMARVYLQEGQEGEAIQSYEQLLNSYPRSSFVRTASLERAMAYRNRGDYMQAMEAYKYTIEQFPASTEAYMAVDGLESLAIENNKVDEYIAYSQNLSKFNMQVASHEDSLRFVAAEMLFHQDRIEEAIATYLPLVERVGSVYAEPACAQVAALYYDQANYEQAYAYYSQLITLSSSRQQTCIARMGALRSAESLKKYTEVIRLASAILTDTPVDAEVQSKALFARAYAYYYTQQYALAVTDWMNTNKDVRTSMGAESQYRLADCYFQMGALDQAENTILSFAQQPTQQQYWLARSLILLAQVSQQRGDDFQARQYLLSLKANYKQQDDIITRVDNQLAALDAVSTTKEEDSL